MFDISAFRVTARGARVGVFYSIGGATFSVHMVRGHRTWMVGAWSVCAGRWRYSHV